MNTRIDVPYISQIDNSKRGNDCGLAAALSIARWVGKGETTAVDDLSVKYDTEQNGTNAADLGAALKSLGLHPTYGVSTYPYITLVHYPRLPRRYDKKYEKLHWIVRLSDTEYHDPLWPGKAGANLEATKAELDDAETKLWPIEQRRVGIQEVPVDNGDSGGTTKAPPVATIIRPPYDKTYHVVVGGTQDQRDSVYLLASSRGESATCSADDGALDLLQVTPDGVSEFKSRTIYFYGVTNQDGFNKFVAGAHPGTKPPAIYYRPWPGTPIVYPTPTIMATPSTITAGQSSTVAWDAPVATSATLNGANVATTQSSTMRPATTMTYTLVAKYPDASTQTKATTVTVTPVTPPPPAGVKLGVNVLSNHSIAYDYAARGCRYFQIFDNFGVAAQLKRQYPDAIVIHRHYLGWSMGGQALADYMLAGELHQDVIYETVNEQDHGQAYGTPDELRNRLDAELSAAVIVRQRGYKVSLGAYSMGTPDFWNALIIDQFKTRVAPLYNNDPGIYIGFHLYTRKYDTDFDIWYARRWQRLFEVCGFDPAKRKVLCSETGVDEGGVGGFPAHAYTIDQFRFWCRSWLSCQAQPVENSTSQILGGAIFQVGNRSSLLSVRGRRADVPKASIDRSADRMAPRCASAGRRRRADEGRPRGWAGYNIEGYIPVLEEFWK